MEQCNYREWGQIFDERMKIRRQVMEALGMILPKNVDEKTREAIMLSMINCAGPPEFCPNRERARATATTEACVASNCA